MTEPSEPARGRGVLRGTPLCSGRLHLPRPGLSDEQRAVIEAARRIDWDELDLATGCLEGNVLMHPGGHVDLYESLEAFAAQVQALRLALSMLKAAETRALLVEGRPLGYPRAKPGLPEKDQDWRQRPARCAIHYTRNRPEPAPREPEADTDGKRGKR